MRTIDQMISQEVCACASGIVATLAGVYGTTIIPNPDASDLALQAFELACPIDDWEEAATQEGWTGPHTDNFGVTYFSDSSDPERIATWACRDWQSLCQEFDIDPYQREIFEHWIVSDWLADKLLEEGEKVDKDFAGLCVWARTTTGQMISADGVIERIYAATHKAG